VETIKPKEMKNATLSLNWNVNKLSEILESKGFDLYLSTKSLKHEERNIVHDIYTCTNGKFDGEVVDVHYNFETGLIHDVATSSQRHTEDGGAYETTPKIGNYFNSL
jgi:hypothetical protein